MYTYTTVREIVDSLNLEILNEGNLDLKIDIPNIYQIGYELVGFLDKDSDELNRYINICSLKESRFIATFSKERKESVISKFNESTISLTVVYVYIFPPYNLDIKVYKFPQFLLSHCLILFLLLH